MSERYSNGVCAIDDEGGEDVFLATKVCLKFTCQTWRRGRTSPTRPRLKLVHGLWTCPKCSASYGSYK